MTLTLFAYQTAVGPGLPVSFLASGGTPPYLYSVWDVGEFAGGTINFTTGVYTSPEEIPNSPRKQYDTIVVTDALRNKASRRIMVASPILLLCDILKNRLLLDDDHVYVWNQKLKEPDDYNLYICLIIPNLQPFSNTSKFDPITNRNIQSSNFLTTIDLNLISRGPAARDDQHKVLHALNSQYSQQQQTINSFSIGKIPSNQKFMNLSGIDGAAIPYRYHTSINLTYFKQTFENVDYYDNFSQAELIVET